MSLPLGKKDFMKLLKKTDKPKQTDKQPKNSICEHYSLKKRKEKKKKAILAMFAVFKEKKKSRS